jgi:hypothetical protein
VGRPHLAGQGSDTPVGPGHNSFSGNSKNVWVDGQDRLHLAITHRRRIWWASEILSRASLGSGTYTFTLDSRVDRFDPNVVVGLFTWSDRPIYHHQEIDVELTRWGDPTMRNSQFLVQPYQHDGNLHRFRNALAGRQCRTCRSMWTSRST